MHTASAALQSALKNGENLHAEARVIVEWNQNRYAGILKVDSTPTEASQGYDLSAFPIASIAQPNRPTRGIVKARATGGTPTSSSAWAGSKEGYTTANYSYRPGAARYYTVSDEALYKYWCSPDASNASAGTGKYSFPTTIQPYVLYKKTCWINKIVVNFENSWASPVDFQIQVTTNGGTNWTTVATNPSINSKGQVILYRQANGTWSGGVYRENPTQVNGIRLIVTTINKLGSYFNLIELSTRLESDLSQFLVSYETDNTMSEPNFITPLGRASSNTGNIVLSNIDSRFNNDNASSLYYGLIDKGALFTVDIKIDSTEFGGNNTEWIRQLTMYSDDWTGPEPDTVTVSLKDFSKFLQEIKVQNHLLQSVTIGEAVWRICDMVGFVDYIYDKKDEDPATVIPYFWTTDEQTVWEVFSKMAEATQTAIFFDEYGILKIQTRNAAYNLAKSTSWAFDATSSGGDLPDIIEADVSNDFEANKVDITYKNTKISDDNKGFPQMEVIWQPEGTAVLRASELIKTMTSGATTFTIDPRDAAVWPYEGLVNIEGEFIRYKGKGYYYYNKSGVLTGKTLFSDDDKIATDRDLSSPTLAYKNYFSGYFAITERGVGNTVPAAHSVDITGYTARYSTLGGGSGSYHYSNFGFLHAKADSAMRLATNNTFSPNSYYLASRGDALGSMPYSFGTRIRFPVSGYTHGYAGLALAVGSSDSGYYIELARTRFINANNLRTAIHELNFVVRHANNTITRVGPNGGKGVPINIAEGVWYDLEVKFHQSGGFHVFDIWVNGEKRMQVTVGTGVPLGGRFGVFTRGFTIADFEYLYAINTFEPLPFDTYSYEDKIAGGNVSGQWDREYVYQTRSALRKVKNKSVRYTQVYNQRFFDEFGPIVHEIREYDIKFEKSPVIHSNVYCTNVGQTVVPEYYANPFKAKFWIANASRSNAIINGEDKVTFGADNPVDQRLLVYGRVVFQEDEKTVTFKNDDAINRRGIVDVEISNEWIQTASMANSIGNWILTHWAGGSDEVELQVFGNPLIQLGDVVSVNYPVKNMLAATHKYFVVAVRQSFDGALETRLTLRRAKV